MRRGSRAGRRSGPAGLRARSGTRTLRLAGLHRHLDELHTLAGQCALHDVVGAHRDATAGDDDVGIRHDLLQRGQELRIRVPDGCADLRGQGSERMPEGLGKTDSLEHHAPQLFEKRRFAIGFVVLLTPNSPADDQAGQLQAGELTLSGTGARRSDELIGLEASVGLAEEHAENPLLRSRKERICQTLATRTGALRHAQYGHDRAQYGHACQLIRLKPEG